MKSPMIMEHEDHDTFALVGKCCSLIDDPEKALSVNEGHSLVPWCGRKSLLIDRFDCRAHLSDLRDYESTVTLEPEDYLTEDEMAIEQMCEFERYLELQVDLDDMVAEKEEEKKRELEHRNQYGAVDFSYESSEFATTEQSESAENNVQPQELSDPVEDPYICPPELHSLSNLSLPKTDKQAQIIERTAVFVARQGNQMEIVLKAKQKSNQLFEFLNYDNDLNPFYKEMVKLIRQSRYVPKIRAQVKQEVKIEQGSELSTIEETYELKLPKIDISTTAYASLINKFKKVNESASKNESISAVQVDSETPQTDQIKTSPTSESAQREEAEIHSDDSSSRSPDCISKDTENTKAETTTNDELKDDKPMECSAEEYEQCYQEYYKHYYAHYYTLFNDQQTKLAHQSGWAIPKDHQSEIVQQAAKAAAVAASAAVNAMYQVRSKEKATPLHTMTQGERGIIDKMAEYVARNGVEFEELVTEQKGNDPRFGFLKTKHPFHSYYLERRQRALKSLSISPDHSKSLDANQSPKSDRSGSPVDAHAKSKTSSDLPTDRQSSISFKLSKPNSSSKIHSSTDQNGSSTHTSVYVHSSLATAPPRPKSSPVLGNLCNSPHKPSTPVHSLVSIPSSSGSVVLDHSPTSRPVKFSLPGIPSASSSSSSSRASSVNSRSPSPQASRSQSTPSPPPPVSLRTNDSDYAHRYPRVHHRSPSPNPFLYPRTDIICAPPSPLSPQREDSPVLSPSNPKYIEHMLDHDRDSPLSRSPMSSSSQHSGSTRHDERLQLERRKKAALLMAKLYSGVNSNHHSPPPHTSDLRHHRASSSVSQYAAPPPAPDSVPAAVAHAVVASLKRRQDDSLSALKAKAKSRKQSRPPPAAYALPKEKSHKSKHRKSSPSPVRTFDFDEDTRNRKHSKKHHKR